MAGVYLGRERHEERWGRRGKPAKTGGSVVFEAGKIRGMEKAHPISV